MTDTHDAGNEHSDISKVDEDATIVTAGAALPDIPGFRLISPLGEGGMATVFLAEDLKLKKRVAIKLMSAELGERDEFRTRFEDEGAILANLKHPNIVGVYQAGDHENRQYLVMEYVPGASLKKRLGEERVLEATEAVRIAAGLADALRYTHERGAVHRDIKPANILFEPDGTPMLADFGIAKSSEFQTTHTQTGMSLLTVRYASPEQLKADPVDGKTDVYSLGLVFYEMLAGDIPHDAPRVVRSKADIRLLQDQLPKAYRRYVNIVAECLRQDPKARPDAAALALQLKVLGQREERKSHRRQSKFQLPIFAGIVLALGVTSYVLLNTTPVTFKLSPASTELYLEGNKLTSNILEVGRGTSQVAAVADGYVGTLVSVSSGDAPLIEIVLSPLTNPSQEDFDRFDDRFFPTDLTIQPRHDDITYPLFKSLLAWKMAASAGADTQHWRDQVLTLAELGDTSGELMLFLASIGKLIDIENVQAQAAIKAASDTKLGLATFYFASMYHMERLGNMNPEEEDVYRELIRRAESEGAAYTLK